MSFINRNVFVKSSVEVLTSGKQNYETFVSDSDMHNAYAVTRDGIMWTPSGLKLKMPDKNSCFSYFIPSFIVSNDFDCPSNSISTISKMKNLEGENVIRITKREVTSLPMRNGEMKDFYVEKMHVEDKDVKILTALEPVEMIGLKLEKNGYENSGLDRACDKFYSQLSDNVKSHICPAVIKCPNEFDNVWNGEETCPLENVLDVSRQIDMEM